MRVCVQPRLRIPQSLLRHHFPTPVCPHHLRQHQPRRAAAEKPQSHGGCGRGRREGKGRKGAISTACKERSAENSLGATHQVKRLLKFPTTAVHPPSVSLPTAVPHLLLSIQGSPSLHAAGTEPPLPLTLPLMAPFLPWIGLSHLTAALSSCRGLENCL